MKIAAELIGKVSPYHSNMGNGTRKYYLFTSNSGLRAPWNLYGTTVGSNLVGLGQRSTQHSGAGFGATGIAYSAGIAYVSLDVSISLDNIPLADPSVNVQARTGSAIRVHRIFGKWMLQRIPSTIDFTTLTNMAQRTPRIIHYIQRLPVAISASVDGTTDAYNSGPVSVCGTSLWPTPATNATWNASIVDFLVYSTQGTFNPAPSLDTTLTTWTPMDSKNSDLARCLHRSPTSPTELYDVKQHEPPLANTSNWGGGTTSGTSNAGTWLTSVEQFQTVPPAMYDFPIEHRFHKPLKITYLDQSVTSASVAAINQLRLKYWQDCTGVLLHQTSNTAVATGYRAGYSDRLGYECWVEFEDEQEDP